MHPATDGSDNDETEDDQSIHLFMDSSNSESVQDEEDVSCYVDESVLEEEEDDEVVESFDDEQSAAYHHIQDGEGHGSDQCTEQPCSVFHQISLQLKNVEALLDMEHTEDATSV
uniref:Uncharacterized protein n=1 Tax=Knipowitschia caucasica TaxID=637954 RepID=A0AAV2JMZ6_KNICA